MLNAGDSSIVLLGIALVGLVVLGYVLFAFNKRHGRDGELKSNHQESTSRAHDAGLLDQSRTSASEPLIPQWKPKHKIFLSHSGVQKAFTEHLCEKLEAVQHFPFFDKRSDSLRKGEKFYPPLMKAAEVCLVAILVLSDEYFTNSKWPMMELNEFVKAQESSNKRLKILPLFLKITREEFNRKGNGKEWVAAWKAFQQSDKSINISEWQHALFKVPGNNGIEYGGEMEGEAEFIKKVVAAVCKLGVPADVKWDTSHVQSREALCGPILNKLKDVEVSNKYKVRIVGLHGVGGVGKTTISREVCNQMVGDFAGKVCHVEFGGMNLMELMKTILQELTEAGPQILIDDHDRLVYVLKERLRLHKVFLVLDNIWDNQTEEVEIYLNAGYHDGSMLLLTSRSRDVLEKRLQIPSCNCMEMPNLDEKGAVDLLLHYSKYPRKFIEGADGWKIVEKCLKECYFLKEERVESNESIERSYHYHPLALKVLGRQLGSMSLEVWKENLKKMEVDRFNMLKDRVHPIFSILRIGYDELDTEEQYIFLDLALIWVSKLKSWDSRLRFEWKWLCIIHRKSEADMKESVKALYRKGLLEHIDEVEQLDYSIHDLYVEFAESEARKKLFWERRFLLDKYNTDVPHELLVEPCGSCWPSLERLIIHNNGARSLESANLYHCKNVEVLDLRQCEELLEVDFTGMVNLRCIVTTHCTMLRKLVGLEKLRNLVILRLTTNPNLRELRDDLGGLKQLQFLDVSWCKNLTSIVGIAHATALHYLNASRCDNLTELPDDFVGLRQLQFLDVRGCKNLSSLVGIVHATALQHLDASWCDNLTELPDDFTGLKQLQFVDFLDVRGCGNLTSLAAIAHAKALQHLDTSWCHNLRKLPDDFRGLKQLKFLDVSWCGNLTSIAGVAHATALQHLNASGCCKLTELPGDFTGLKQLQFLDMSGCENLSSIVDIAHVSALQQLDTSRCDNSRELPDDFAGLKLLEMVDLRLYPKH